MHLPAGTDAAVRCTDMHAAVTAAVVVALVACVAHARLEDDVATFKFRIVSTLWSFDPEQV